MGNWFTDTLGFTTPDVASVPNYMHDWREYEGERQKARWAVAEQAKIADGYGQVIAGTAPSVAQAQLQQAQLQANQQQMAMANSAGGGALGSAAAYRQAMMGQADMAHKTAYSAAELRAQEAAHARDAQAALYGQAMEQSRLMTQMELDRQRGLADNYYQREQIQSGARAAAEAERSRRFQGTMGAIIGGAKAATGAPAGAPA